jgi:hypothetical protein
MLTKKHLHFRFVFFILKIPDHIREPNRQPIVTVTEKTECLSNKWLIPSGSQSAFLTWCRSEVVIWFLIRKSNNIKLITLVGQRKKSLQSSQMLKGHWLEKNPSWLKKHTLIDYGLIDTSLTQRKKQISAQKLES